MAKSNEKKLIELLAKIDRDFGFITGVCLAAREFQKVDELVKFIEEEPNANGDDIVNFVLGEDFFEERSQAE